MLKKYILTILSLEILTSGILLSQPILEWVKFYPDTTTSFNAGSHAIVLDDSGNSYITGYANPPSSSWNSFCTVKYSSTGIRQWVAHYYGTNSGGRQAYAIAIDSFRNIFVTGFSYEEGRNFDYCTIKYNSDGERLWVQKYDGPSHGYDEAQKIAVDNAGNIYVTGVSALTGGLSLQITTVKYSTDGKELWVQRCGIPYSGSNANGIAVDDSCNVYVTGTNNTAAITVKYDSSGSEKWVQTYSGNVTGTSANAIALDKNGNVYITGKSRWQEINYSHDDFFTIKYSSLGTLQWVERFYNENPLYNYNESNSLCIDNLNNIYISGNTASREGIVLPYYCTIKYSSFGEQIWIREDSNETLAGRVRMCIDKNNNIYVGFDSASKKFVTVKIDTSGNEIWKTKYYTGSLFAGLEVDNFTNILLTGGSGKMIAIKYSQLTGIINLKNEIPDSFRLFQNYPNPFNSITKIKFDLPFPSSSVWDKIYVELVIYDLLGRVIANPVKGFFYRGSYEFDWNASNYASGIYYSKLIIKSLSNQDKFYFYQTKKMVLLR